MKKKEHNNKKISFIFNNSNFRLDGIIFMFITFELT